MKAFTPLLLVLLSIGLCLTLSTCTKEEDSDLIRKEAITNILNNEISADTLQSLVVWMQEMGTRFMLTENRQEVARNIKKRFIMLGYANTRIDSFMVDRTYRDINYQQWQYNVIATLEGNSYPDSVCIIGAHYDNILKTGDPFLIVPGANDNASGVAATLEIARVMKKKRYSPHNTIEFITFGAEELGLYGSKDYAYKSGMSNNNIKFMLNNDMIAYQPKVNKSEWVVNIIDYENSHNLRLEAEDMCNRFTCLSFTNDNKYNAQSDSYPFFTNGYKALFFISDILDPNYHSLNDISENCNFEYCREITRISCAILVYNN